MIPCRDTKGQEEAAFFIVPYYMHPDHYMYPDSYMHPVSSAYRKASLFS